MEFYLGFYVGVLVTVIAWAIHLAYLATKERKRRNR